MSDSVRPHRRQPTRLPRPWDSLGKNTGVGCHFLLQWMKVKVKSISHVWLLATPWTAAYQAPPPRDFSGKSTGVGCHCLLRMYSAYKLNKQDDNMQPWSTPFPIWNQSVAPYPVLTVASWPSYRFLRRQIRWSGSPFSWWFFHGLLWSTQSKALA